MKRKFTFLIAALMLLTMMVLPGQAVGQTTHTIGWGTASGEAGTYTNFSDVSGTVTNVLSFISQKNNSGTDPAYNSGSSELRLYYHSGGNGGSITITPATGITITGAVMTTSTTPSVSYYVNGGSAVSVTASNNTYTISNISATTSLEIQNVNTSNTQLRIKTIAITYTVSSNPSISAENVNINADATSGSISYQINNGTSGAMVSAEVLDGSTISNLAIDNDNITTATVPFTCEANTANTAKTATVRLTYGNVTKDVTITQARYVPQVSGYNIDFEYETESYVDWTFSNIVSKLSGTGSPNTIQAHGGSYYASTGGHGTASITTESVIANPGTLTCYITKTTTNTTSSTWKIQVKTAEANNWIDVKSQSATSMTQGTWNEFTADLSNYSNVYVRVYYDGSTAVRNIDDLSLTMASTDPSITAANVDIAYDAENGSIAYTIKNTPNPAGTLTATIAQSPASTIEGLTIGTINGSTVAFTCNANNTTTARTATVTLTYTYGDNQTTTKDVVITQAAHPTPSITAFDVNINGDATNGSIAYEINDGITGGSLSASTTSTWLTPGVVTNEAVPFTCEANQGAARSATVVLTYTYNTNQTVTKNVTVTQAKAPYTTIPAMFAGATNSNQTVDVIFNNWLVSGVSSNGKNVFVTDNQGNGFVINFSSDQSSTYDVGKILSGTASSCTLKLNNGYAQLTSVSGLTINTGGTVSVADIAMADLSGVHTGALVSYTNLTGSVTDNKYYLSDGTTTIQIYGSLISSSIPIVASKKYDITGIYQQYGNTKEVLPRSADDIVLKADMSSTDLSVLTEFTYLYDEGGETTSDAQHIEVYCDDLGTNNLTASVSTGYEVSLTVNGTYSSSVVMTPDEGSVMADLYIRLGVGLSTGEHNGTLTFTATNLTTVEKTLIGSVTETPTYNVNIDDLTNGTITATPSVAEAGTEITLTITPYDCYQLKSGTLIVMDDDFNEITVTNNKFNMPESNVLVSAEFEIKTYTVSYSVNGVVGVLDNDIVDCGDDAYLYDADDLEDAGVSLPTGYSFAGWSTSPASTAVVSSFSPTADATLYAVWAPSGSSSDYVKVTEDLDDWSGEYLIVYEDSENGNKALNGGLTTMDASGNTISVSISIISGNSVIESNSTTDAARVIIASKTNGYSIKSASNLYIGHSGNSNTLNTSSKDDYTNTISLDGSVSIQCGDYKLKYNKASGQERFRYYTSGQQDIQLYKKQTATPYTYIEDITSTTATLPSIEPTYLITVKNGGVLTLTGANNGDETNLIIEDGGQLIILKSDNDPVALTAKKKIANADSKDPKDHWYTISSSVHTGSNDYVTIGNETTVNLTASSYDMFEYDEPNHYWRNQKASAGIAAGFEVMNVGQGYLYRNSGNELSFVGNANFGDVTIDLSYTENLDVENLRGFNLIGNPYTHSIAKGSGKAIVNVVNENTDDEKTVLSNGCYVLSDSGTWDLITDGNEIKPNQGVLVETSEAVANFQIKDINYVAPAPGKYNNDNIKFMVENAEYSDATYAWFDKGIGLTKISHRNERAPMIYIPQDGHNYAIAIMSDDTKVFGLNFKTATMGQYTLSYKATGEYRYLHVVDRLTGEDVDMLIDGKYTFVATPNDKENRFIVKLSYTPDYSEGDNDMFAYQTGNEILVSGNGELQIFDVTGRQVMTTTINGAESISVPAQGVYIFRLVGNDIKTQKIVVR